MSVKALKDLKSKYLRNNVSLLIGSGFSKNASDKFPLWGPLLEDMILEVFPEINDPNSDFKKIYQSYGYLGVIDKFLSVKGIRESIEAYIQNHIPVIDYKTGALRINSKKVDKLDDANLELHLKLLEGNWKNIFTTNYDQLLEYCNYKNKKHWEVIEDSSKLSIGEDSAIIKLHGTLSCNNHFYFDGQVRHKYIFTREDYQKYPNEHEAFTQLMRISLLRGTFCLLGFSGEDPNFTSWVYWVRSVVQSNTAEKELPNIKKIYLIALSVKQLPEDRRLFYQNHKIELISLRDKQVLKAIAGSATDSDKDIIRKFLQYLYDKEDVNIILSRISNDLSSISTNQKMELFKTLDKLRNSIEISPNLLINILLKYSKRNPDSLDDSDLKILSFIYCSCPLWIGSFPKLEERLENLKDFQQAWTIQNSFKTPLNQKNLTGYQKALQAAFNLDFSTLKKAINQWKPNKNQILQKSLISMVFEDQHPSVKVMLRKFLNDEVSTQDRYLASSFYNSMMIWSSPIKGNTFNHQNITRIDTICNNITNAFKEKKEVSPYDSDTAYSITVSSSNLTRPYRFFQLFQIPLFNPLRTVKLGLNDSDWFEIFTKTFEAYPLPCLFLSALCTDQKVLTRIGQEYAFSTSLKNSGTIAIILSRLLSAFDDPETPTNMKNALMRIAMPIFVSVNPSEWQKDVLNIVRSQINVINSPNDGETLLAFVLNASYFIRDHQVAFDLIRILIKNIKNIKYTLHMSYALWCLNNLGVKCKFADREQLAQYQRTLMELLDENIPFSSKNRISILALLQEILPRDFITKNLLSSLLLGAPEQDTSPQELFSYLKLASIINNTTAMEKVKKSIINSCFLWHNGISDTGMSSPIFIPLLDFDIHFTDQEVIQIFCKLRKSFDVMISKRVLDKSFLPYLYLALMSEMSLFLRLYERVLINTKGFESFKKQFHRVYFQYRKFESLKEGLVSCDSQQVSIALDEALLEARVQIIKGDSLSLITNLVIFSKNSNVTKGLKVLATYLTKSRQRDNVLSDQLITGLKNILQTYDLANLRAVDLHVPLCASYLVKIATVLKQHEIEALEIEKWLKIKEDQNFNFFDL